MIFATLLMLADVVASAPTDAAPAEVNKAGKSGGDAVRCVREDVIGSLSKKIKTCHTEREWAEIRSEAQRETARISQPGAPTQGN